MIIYLITIIDINCHGGRKNYDLFLHSDDVSCIFM